jgi:hypothetical protein
LEPVTPLPAQEVARNAARLRLRKHARRILAKPGDAEAHRARVEAALLIDGTEAVQGALADMFTLLDARFVDAKREAFEACAGRLSPRAHAAFAQVHALGALPRINPLATRWSLLSIPTADIPARARRCSLDDSRKLAAQGIAAFEAQDADSEQSFLDHCLTCHDKMAFMLARQVVLKKLDRLPPHWEAVGNRLEEL